MFAALRWPPCNSSSALAGRMPTPRAGSVAVMEVGQVAAHLDAVRRSDTLARKARSTHEQQPHAGHSPSDERIRLLAELQQLTADRTATHGGHDQRAFIVAEPRTESLAIRVGRRVEG